MSARTGRVMGVSGNLVTVEFDVAVSQNEVAYVLLGDLRLIAEVIRVRGRYADMQVFESTAGIKVGDPVEFVGELLSVELGPGLLSRVFDGLQNPLNVIAERHGFFLPRGEQTEALPRDQVWSSRRGPPPATACAPATPWAWSPRASSSTGSPRCSGSSGRPRSPRSPRPASTPSRTGSPCFGVPAASASRSRCCSAGRSSCRSGLCGAGAAHGADGHPHAHP